MRAPRYDGNDALLGTFTGHDSLTHSRPLLSTAGKVKCVFSAEHSANGQGFTARYEILIGPAVTMPPMVLESGEPIDGSQQATGTQRQRPQGLRSGRSVVMAPAAETRGPRACLRLPPSLQHGMQHRVQHRVWHRVYDRVQHGVQYQVQHCVQHWVQQEVQHRVQHRVQPVHHHV